LINVECRNFLNDYQSLIHIENDNYITISKKVTMTGSHYGSGKVGGRITIKNCRFVDSSFTYGMLMVTPEKPAALKAADVLVFTYGD
jgi:hypothetical protein